MNTKADELSTWPTDFYPRRIDVALSELWPAQYDPAKAQLCLPKWPHNWGTHDVSRAAETAISTAVRLRSMVRMGVSPQKTGPSAKARG
jgi:hypothetical protein